MLFQWRLMSAARTLSRRRVMPHEVAPLPFKPTLLNGLSERLLASHYENNYGGAVRRLQGYSVLVMKSRARVAGRS